LERGVDVHLLVPDDYTDRVSDAGRVHRISLSRLRWNLDVAGHVRSLRAVPPDVRTIASHLDTVGADIVRVSGPHNPHGALAARRTGRPVVWALSNELNPLIRVVGSHWIGHLADGLLVNGESLRALYLRSTALRGLPVGVYYAPVDTSRFNFAVRRCRDATRAELGISGDAFVVGTVGNVSVHKGTDVFISAFAALAREAPDAHAVVVGRPATPGSVFARQLERLVATSGASQRVHFVGHADAPENYLGAFDVAVIPSRFEGTTATVGEAMACGIPVVASRTGGIVDVVRDGVTGWLVPPDDPTALALAVQRCRTDVVGVADAVDRARDFVNRQLSPKAVADQQLSLLRQLRLL
jgi:glycosyltransferase involved in cell wall biosynthesis